MRQGIRTLVGRKPAIPLFFVSTLSSVQCQTYLHFFLVRRLKYPSIEGPRTRSSQAAESNFPVLMRSVRLDSQNRVKKAKNSAHEIDPSALLIADRNRTPGSSRTALTLIYCTLTSFTLICYRDFYCFFRVSS